MYLPFKTDPDMKMLSVILCLCIVYPAISWSQFKQLRPEESVSGLDQNLRPASLKNLA